MRKQAVHLYLFGEPDPRNPPGPPRWVPGDQYPRTMVRRLRGRQREQVPSGFSMVARNLVRGLHAIRHPYRLHLEAVPPTGSGPVGIVHGPRDTVRRIASETPCITGPGVLSTPEQWPRLFDKTHAVLHLSASEWAADLLRRR